MSAALFASPMFDAHTAVGTFVGFVCLISSFMFLFAVLYLGHVDVSHPEKRKRFLSDAEQLLKPKASNDRYADDRVRADDEPGKS
jgi:hypothetical protein